MTMFNYDELNALASNAKAQLKQQNGIKESEEVDLYEGLFDDTVNLENNITIDKEEEINYNS